MLTLLYLVVGILGLDIIIIIHELGHFAACKIFGVHVESLNIGFGPSVFSKTKNGTTYRICLIPIGGSTKMLGHEDIKRAIDKGEKKIENCEEGSLYSVSKLRRILIYLSGPLANILFAVICFTAFLCSYTLVSDSQSRIVLSSDYPSLYSNVCPAAESELKTGDRIYAVNNIEVNSYSELTSALAQFKDNNSVWLKTDEKTIAVHPENGLYGILPFKEAVVGEVQIGSNEQRAGLKSGDIILTANGVAVSNMFDLLNEAELSDSMVFEVKRANKTRTVSFEVENKALNFTLKSETIRKDGEPLGIALTKAVKECRAETVLFFDSLVMLLKGQLKLSQAIGGTIYASENMGMMTTKAFNASLNTGIRTLLYLIASVSISLAVANFLPITALDGGLILINLIELVFRKSFSPKTYVVLQVLGLITMFIVIPIAKLFF